MKTIPGYPLYQACKDGTIWKGGKRVKTHLNRGYFYVNLWRTEDGWHPYPVHQLILKTFKGLCPPGHCARHYPDQTRTNNRLANLSWSTHSCNLMDKVENGTSNRGERCATSKLTRSQVDEIKKQNKEGIGYRRLSKMFGVSVRTIYDIMKKKTWSYA